MQFQQVVHGLRQSVPKSNLRAAPAHGLSGLPILSPASSPGYALDSRGRARSWRFLIPSPGIGPGRTPRAGQRWTFGHFRPVSSRISSPGALEYKPSASVARRPLGASLGLDKPNARSADWYKPGPETGGKVRNLLKTIPRSEIHPMYLLYGEESCTDGQAGY